METYISLLFKKNQLKLEESTVGYMNIIENGIGHPKEKCRQIKDAELQLYFRLLEDMVIENKTHHNENHHLSQIQIRRAIAVWNANTASLENYLKRFKIAYAINFTQIPPIEGNNSLNLLKRIEYKLPKDKNRDHIINYLRKNIFFENETDTKKLFNLIMGNNKRFKRNLRGEIGEEITKYLIEKNSSEKIELTSNFKKEFESVEYKGNRTYIGYQKEIDFILTSTKSSPFIQFMNNLKEQNISIIKNEAYQPNIITTKFF